MIYLDNAATSRFKPQMVYDALIYDLRHSANSGRSGHKDAIFASERIELCREFLKEKLGANDKYHLIFTKSCTEALNLAIFGCLKQGDRVVTSQNEHNSVLRPLFHLKSKGIIQLEVLARDKNTYVNFEKLDSSLEGARLCVLSGASNVTGDVLDVERVAKLTKKHNVKLLVDGAQSVPICDTNMSSFQIDMLACPAHKGLHATQGIGFLIFKNDIELCPILHGGTGSFSSELTPPILIPDSFEVGTQFSAGISALYEGAKWTYTNLEKIKINTVRLSKMLISSLEAIGATLYTKNVTTGVVAFNFKDVDSNLIADNLAEKEIALRAGLHCAPLCHQSLGTLHQGAVRVSIGCDNTESDIARFLKITQRLCEQYR